MCVPTLSAVAVTLESVLGLRGSQFSVLQTLKVRTFPESTGVAAAEMRDGARSGLGTCAANSRSARRNRRSNCCATLGPATSDAPGADRAASAVPPSLNGCESRSEEHTSELQSQSNLVCRLLLEKKKKKKRPQDEMTL